MPEEKPSTYFKDRMDLLGVTPENNKIAIWKNKISEKGHEDVLEEVPIFREVPEGIEILVYTLERSTIRIEKNGSRMKKDFGIVRLEKPVVKPNGDSMKYRIPKGAGTHPFFPPSLVEKFENKTDIETLFLVEGYFKAWEAAMYGADIIGLSSITHMKDKETGALHPDILKLMLTCNVRRMMWLTDGDALDITQKELTEGLDLSKRPRQFFASVQTFHSLLADYEVEKWFVYIDTDSILERNPGMLREKVKGIDDLLITFNKKNPDALFSMASEIINELNSISSPSIFFQKFNITYGTNKVYTHFRLRDVKEFYLFHVERRPELKNKEFIFNGTRYQYDEEKLECLVKIPGDAKLYFRVADDYYKFVNLPNQYKQLERVFHGRKKGTITDDHGRNFTKHIPKYEAFCNVPSHNEFQQIIENCFNVYSPVDHLPDDEECFESDFPAIKSLLYHIFGEKIVSYHDKELKTKKEYRTVDLAYDYLQLLYRKPEQKLPILCLVSRENNTGKTTFANFLRMMLGANVAIVGNADMVNDFNAHWATKSVVVCDETKIDKQIVLEKIKSLSTAKKVFMNAKNRAQVELDCFIKFVLLTNNEESFISASDDDIRYWVLKVPELKTDNPTILEQIEKEIPMLLSFLVKRKMATEMKGRMWFHPMLLRTEAFNRVVAYSEPTIVKELKQFFKDLFLDTGLQKILMTKKVVHKEVFNNKYERNYLDHVLEQKLKLRAFHVWVVDGVEHEYDTEEEALAAAGIKYPDCEGYMLKGKINIKYKVTRYTYPRWEEAIKDGKKEVQRFEISDNGRPYVFYRSDFVKDDEVVDVGLENEQLAVSLNGNGHTKEDNTLPFPILRK